MELWCYYVGNNRVIILIVVVVYTRYFAHFLTRGVIEPCGILFSCEIQGKREKEDFPVVQHIIVADLFPSLLDLNSNSTDF